MKKLVAIMSLIMLTSSLYGSSVFTVTYTNNTKEDYVVNVIFACNKSASITVKSGDTGSFTSEPCCITSFTVHGVYQYGSPAIQICSDTAYIINYINPSDPSVGIMLTLGTSN